jgi:hypothetical protein
VYVSCSVSERAQAMELAEGFEPPTR